MTLPDERYRSVRWAREFLRELLDPKKTPKVPLTVRRRARSVLKHFPTELDMWMTSQGEQDVFQSDGKSWQQEDEK